MAATTERNVIKVARCVCSRLEYSSLNISLSIRKLSSIHAEENDVKDKTHSAGVSNSRVSHRKHEGVVQVKPVRLPQTLTANIQSILAGQTVRNLVPEATKLANYLQSRKRPVEETELRAAAKHFSEKMGLEEIDEEDIQGPSGSQESKKKIASVMRTLRKNLYKWRPIEYDETKCLAYLISRIPANYAVLYRVFNEIKKRDPNFQPYNILDFGSGVGSTVWAANSLWGDTINEYYLVETSKAMHQLSEALLKVDPSRNEFLIKNIFFRHFMPVSLRTKYSITVSAHSLLELPSFNDRMNIVRTLWKKTQDYLVLVENGSYESYLTLLEARDALLQDSHRQSISDSDQHADESLEASSYQIKDRLITVEQNDGGHVFAPCPHDHACPRLHDDSGTPCNFEQTFHPVPEFVGSRSQNVNTERFSYIILKKGPRVQLNRDSEDSQWPRVVRPVLRRSRHVVCRLCCADGKLKEAVITKSKHPKYLYRCARHTTWGDLLPVSQTDTSQSDTEDSNLDQ